MTVAVTLLNFENGHFNFLALNFAIFDHGEMGIDLGDLVGNFIILVIFVFSRLILMLALISII